MEEHQYPLKDVILSVLGPDYGILPLNKGHASGSVADAPMRGLVVDEHGRPAGVLFLSNAVDPEIVARNVQKASDARCLLGPPLDAVILQPIVEGIHCDRSYVIWPWCRPFSSFRVWHALQKSMLIPRVLAWLRDVIQQTQRALPRQALDVLFEAPLRYVESEQQFRPIMREKAYTALDRMASGLWHPRGVLEHNDFWLGNVLLPPWGVSRTKNPFGFYIIDWAGSSLVGRPLLDTIRFCMSARLSAHRCATELAFYTTVLGFESDDVVSYVLAGLGAIGTNLGHFPFERYVTLCENVFDYLEGAC